MVLFFGPNKEKYVFKFPPITILSAYRFCRRSIENNPEMFPEKHELSRLYEKLHQLKMRCGSVMTDLHKTGAADNIDGIPVFCRGRYNITPTGEVRPCEFHHAVLGNIHESTLDDIIMKAEQTELIKSRDEGFKNYVTPELEDIFDYHTRICHKIPIAM